MCLHRFFNHVSASGIHCSYQQKKVNVEVAASVKIPGQYPTVTLEKQTVLTLNNPSSTIWVFGRIDK